MDAEELVRMANQIALFFAPYPEEDAIEGVRNHLQQFWTPAMRAEIARLVRHEPKQVAILHPLASAAIAQLKPIAAR